MKLNKSQSQELLEAIQASGISIAHVCRKWNFKYSAFWQWVHGNLPGTKHNRYMVYLQAVKAEFGWDVKANNELAHKGGNQ